MLNVDGGDDVDTGTQQLLNVVAPLGITGAGHVGMRQLIDEYDRWMPIQNGVNIHLGEVGASVLITFRGTTSSPSSIWAVWSRP